MLVHFITNPFQGTATCFLTHLCCLLHIHIQSKAQANSLVLPPYLGALKGVFGPSSVLSGPQDTGGAGLASGSSRRAVAEGRGGRQTSAASALFLRVYC